MLVDAFKIVTLSHRYYFRINGRMKNGGIMSKERPKLNISEDWLAVILAFVLILLAAIGLLGKTGLPITF